MTGILRSLQNVAAFDTTRLRESIAIDGRLMDSPLAKRMPPCYQRIAEGNSELVMLDWAPEFNIRGGRVKEREFPCLVLRPGLEIPPWGQSFIIPSTDERFLSWVGAANLRPSWLEHPCNTSLPSATKGVEDARGIARNYRRRLEAYRASRGEPRLEVSSQDGQDQGGMGEATVRTRFT
jgi:hypothetical protein